MNDRKRLEECFRAGVAAVEPQRLVRQWLESHDTRADAVLSIGKAAPAMARGARDLFQTKGIVVTTDETDISGLGNVEVFRAGHPLPDDRGMAAGKKVEKFLNDLQESSTLLVLISGGGSALLPTPYEPLGLDGIKRMTKTLLERGASIQETNTVRRHMERLKGGGMAKATEANIVCLMLSDVIGDEMQSISSGPTVPDPTTCEDALKILSKYHIDPGVEVKNFLSSCWWETTKEDDPIWDRVENHILANNRTALDAVAKKMEEIFGKLPWIIEKPMTGEARQEAIAFNEVLRSKGLVIGGGETVIHVKGKGTGGRNQEMALATISIAGEGTILFASTDGRDGPTDAAGGFCDQLVRAKAGDMGLDPKLALENNDSYGFLAWTDGLFKTGPTGTNVCDLALGVYRG